MKVLIVEDENPAAEKLTRYLKKYDSSIEILKHLTSVADAVSWLKEHQAEVDLLFFDIQLSDGLSFEIFSALSVTKPVIFTTAFDEYALDAFKVNSIDYLLKPVTYTDLSKALKKWEGLRSQYAAPSNLPQMMQQIAQKRHKDRFLVRRGNHIHSIRSENIALFFAEGRNVFFITMDNKKYSLDHKLEALTDMLDPRQFYRLNRSFIVNINAIQDVVVYSNSRLKVQVCCKMEKEMIVSREKVAEFKNWMAGGA